MLGARHFKNHLVGLVKKYNLDGIVEVLETGSFGRYDEGALFLLLPDNIFYKINSEADVERFVEEQLLKGRRVEDLIVEELEGSETIEARTITKEERIVLKRAGEINPKNIDEYIAFDGYQGLAKALQMSPEDVIKEVKESGLRGRGGAGFPAGLKWEFTYKVDAKEKYVICNADEGEPGTFKDRLIMEGDPHSVIEGMAITAYAVGANKGYIYIRGEYLNQSTI